MLKNILRRESPDELFEQAKIEQKQGNWEKASQLYDLALDKFGNLAAVLNTKKGLKTENAILYFRTIINHTLCLIKNQFEKKDEFRFKEATDHLEIVEKKRNKIINVYPQLIDRCHSLEKSLFKKLEEWLTQHGFLNEANQVYLAYQKLVTTHLINKTKINFQQNHFFGAIKNLAKLILRYLFYRLYLGYGIQTKYLISSMVIVILTFGWIYSKFKCIELLSCKPSFIKGVYASVMTFVSFGFDEVAPIDNLGRICVCIEGVLGFITLGGIIAYIWRRMK